jgi:hypothetical protein
MYKRAEARRNQLTQKEPVKSAGSFYYEAQMSWK